VSELRSQRQGWARPAAWALLIFLLLRLCLALLSVRDPSGGVLVDSKDYLTLAQSLVSNGRYADPSGNKADLVRPPGYPALLAALDAAAGGSTAVVTLVQLVLSGAAALLLLAVGMRAGRPQLGLASGWILALSPNLALWSLTVMSETLFAIVLTLSLWLWIRSVRSSDLGDAVLVGLALAAAAYVRPIGLLLIPVWAVAMFCLLRGTVRGRRAMALAGIGIAVGAVVVAGWMVRNKITSGELAFTTVSARTVIGFDLAEVVARAEGITRSQAAEQLRGEGVVQQTLSVAVKYPGQFLRAQFLGLARTASGTDIGTWGNVLDWDRWSGLGLLTGLLGQAPAGDFSQAPQSALEGMVRGGLLAISLAYALALMGLSLLGVIWLPSARDLERGLVTLAFVTAAVLMVVPLAAGQARFRVPAEPFLAVLAAYGLAEARTRWRRWRAADAGDEARSGRDPSAHQGPLSALGTELAYG
jgi:4-amino-4-deoxy-L-arabinose transferase-like glycosyltransferase